MHRGASLSVCLAWRRAEAGARSGERCSYAYAVSAPSDRSAFMRAAFAGSLLAFAIDVVMLSGGQFSLWHQIGLLGSFYDVQGRALLHGHIAVPNGSASFEGFVIDGRTYVYFGLVPALFRLPFLAITHGLDGRMTQLSMLFGFVVLLLSGARLHWRVRETLRPGAPVSGPERIVAFLLALGLGAGAVPLFLASWAVIYHEAELWGAAFSLAAISAVLAVIEQPSARRIAWAGALSLLAVNTRVSVGLGPILALGVVALAVGARALQAVGGGRRRGREVLAFLARFGPRELQRPLPTLALLVAAAAIALSSAVAVNEARFHSAFSIPLQKQVDTSIDPNQRAFVAAYHGAATGLRFVPTTLLAAVRPDAIGTTRAFPFIGLPSSPPTVVGSARFNALLPSLSAFTSMPLFCLLLIAGIPGMVRDRRVDPLLGALAATAAAFLPALVFGSTATRYLADLLPCLFLGACVGVHVRGGVRDRVLQSRRSRRVGLAAVALLVLVGIAVNGAVGLVEQRLIAPTASTATRASFIRAQDDIDHFLGRSPHGVHAGSAYPTRPWDRSAICSCSAGATACTSSASAERGYRSSERLVQVSSISPCSFRPRARRRASRPLLTLGTGRNDHARRNVGARGRGDVLGPGRRTSTERRRTGRRPPGGQTRMTVSIERLGGASFLAVTLRGAGTFVSSAIPYNRVPGSCRCGSAGSTITSLPRERHRADRANARLRPLARRAGLL